MSIQSRSVGPIPTCLFNSLSSFFTDDLTGISIHSGPQARAIAAAHSTPAVAVRNNVYFREAPDFSDPQIRHVLAHEVAHVLQKRRFATGVVAASDSQVEHEARDAAHKWCVGEPCPALSADDPDVPRCYGPAGHFYTAYFVALAGGMPAQRASNIAFYTQIADQISEIDATDVIEKWATRYLLKCCEVVGTHMDVVSLTFGPPALAEMLIVELLDRTRRERARPNSLEEWLRSYGPVAYQKMRNPVDFVALIQRGLHCLTGGSARTEQERRQRELRMTNWADDQSVGLCVHALGDSYAHVRRGDQNTMYSTGLGHAVEFKRGAPSLVLNTVLAANMAVVNPVSGFQMLPGLIRQMKKIEDDMHWVDQISNRPQQYMEYGKTLYDVIRSKTGRPALSPAELEGALQDFCARGSSNEAAQIKMIEERSRGIAKGPMPSTYRPDDGTVSWLGWPGRGYPNVAFDAALDAAAKFSR